MHWTKLVMKSSCSRMKKSKSVNFWDENQLCWICVKSVVIQFWVCSLFIIVRCSPSISENGSPVWGVWTSWFFVFSRVLHLSRLGLTVALKSGITLASAGKFRFRGTWKREQGVERMQTAAHTAEHYPNNHPGGQQQRVKRRLRHCGDELRIILVRRSLTGNLDSTKGSMRAPNERVLVSDGQRHGAVTHRGRNARRPTVAGVTWGAGVVFDLKSKHISFVLCAS